jgi:hypothetical protein
MHDFQNEFEDSSGIPRYVDHQLLFEKKIWTKEDVSLFTGLKLGTIYNKTSMGVIPYKKRGNRLYFIPQDILNWIDEGGK